MRETTREKYLPNILTGEPTNALCGEYAADSEPVLDAKGFDYAWWYSRATCPGIHMPRWASRITLEVTGVRVERLHEISEDDAFAEGIDGPLCAEYTTKAPSRSTLLPAAVHAYFGLWDSINAKCAPWASNPWVWVIEFKRSA